MISFRVRRQQYAIYTQQMDIFIRRNDSRNRLNRRYIVMKQKKRNRTARTKIKIKRVKPGPDWVHTKIKTEQNYTDSLAEKSLRTFYFEKASDVRPEGKRKKNPFEMAH